MVNLAVANTQAGDYGKGTVGLLLRGEKSKPTLYTALPHYYLTFLDKVVQLSYKK